jgi:hypothetical protein
VAAARTRIDELLAAAVAAGDVPGAIATVVDRDGIAYEGVGWRCATSSFRPSRR